MFLFSLRGSGTQKIASQENTRQISTTEGAAYASRMGVLFVESSAKTAEGVREVFRDTLERVLA
jgi:Ras-related protein Rab-18